MAFLPFLYILAGLVVGVLFAAWRLRGDAGFMTAVRRVLPLSGGGPRPGTPR